jgi:hypothetical protein
MTPRARLSVLGLSNGTAHSDRYFDLDQTRVMPRPKASARLHFGTPVRRMCGCNVRIVAVRHRI